MADRTQWFQFFKKRVAPVLMVLVLALLAMRSCEAEPVRIEVVVDFDGGDAAMRRLAVEYFRDGETERVGHMTLTYGRGGAPGPAQHTLQLVPGRYRAVLMLGTDGGVERVERRFHVEDAATVKFRVRPGQ